MKNFCTHFTVVTKHCSGVNRHRCTVRYVALSFLTRNLRETKNVHRCSLSTTRIWKVSFKVTWPWRTRLRAKVTVLAHVALSFLTHKTMETKKLIIAACLQPEIGTDVGDVMTTWRHVEYMLLHATIITSSVFLSLSLFRISYTLAWFSINPHL